MATDTCGSDVPEFPRTRFFVAFGTGSGQVGTGEGEFPCIVHVNGKPADRKAVGLVASVAVFSHTALGKLAVVKVLVAVEAPGMFHRLAEAVLMALAA